MSSGGQIAGGIVGAVAGFFAGGPVGAFQGFAIGSSIGAALDPPKGPTIQGPRLADKSVQVSTYGAMLPRFYGTVGVSGNITWLENNQLKETVRKKKSGGKGGGSSATTKIYTYSATFILSLGLGPIAGVRRIWCGDKLIYNAGSDDLETIIASNQEASGFRLYLGTDDQLPDPRYEADVGVGNASAFRGEAYIAFYDFQLADFANSLQAAQFKVEVVNSVSNSVTLLQQYDEIFTQPFSNDSFLPKPYFVTKEKIVFYAPQWNNAFPSTSSWIVYEFYTSGLRRIYTVTQTGIVSGDVPPAGDTDVDGEFWKSARAMFPATHSFDSDLGYIQHRGSLYVGMSSSPNKRIFVSTGSSASAISIATTANTFAIVGSDIYTFSSDGIRIYDDLLVLQAFHPLVLPSLDFPTARAEMVNGELLLFTSGVSPSLHRISSDFSAVNLIGSIPVNSGSAFDSISVNLSAGMIVRANPGSIPKTLFVQWYNLESLDQSPIALADIVESEVVLSSLLTSSDVDTSELVDTVRGYRVSGGSIRSALEPLQGAFPFDVIQSGYQLKCVPRGQSPALAISWEDLVTDGSQDIGEILKESREMDSQLPVRTNIKYLDADREYAIGEQYSERPNTQAINRVDREFSIVITADEAAKVADVLNNLPWQERTTAQTSLPPTMLALEPSDVITVTTPFSVFEYRISEAKYSANGSIDIQVRQNNAALYISSAEGSEGVPPSGIIGLQGPTLLIPFDIPVVDETIQDSPGFGAVAMGFTGGWPGATAFRTVDSGQTWTEVQGFNGIASAGFVRGTLPSSSSTLIDQRSIIVSLVSGELESVTRDQMLSGVNYAAYGINGRWEIVRFQNAALQSDGSYLVSGFVRGERGTEWATGLHAEQDYFILLDDPDNVFIDSAIASIGVTSVYRGVTSGASIDSASDVSFTYNGVNLECLSPVYAKGVRDGSSNFTGTFTRRSRLSNSWWANGVEAPLGESTQSYEIDVMSGSTVKRTITASTPTFTYSAANQTTDFGSPQASITFRIYQLSAVVGRGFVYEVTL